MSAPVQIPADVDREDQILGSLTARQVTIAATAAAFVYGAWHLTGPQHLVVFAVLIAPVVIVAIVLVVGRREGVTLDRLLVAAARQRLSLPTAGRSGGDPTAPVGAGRRVAARLPLEGVRASGPDRLGILDLAGAGSALVCAVSPLNLTLRSGHEQDAVIGGFARWLHSLAGPVQILTRSRPLDLSTPVAHLHTAAATLSEPALAAAARAHIAHLQALGDRVELLHREMLLVFRDPTPVRGPRAAATTGDGLRRRAAEATALLAPLGLRVTPLGDADAAAVLRRATAPATGLHPTAATRAEPRSSTVGAADLDSPTVEIPIPPPHRARPLISRPANKGAGR